MATGSAEEIEEERRLLYVAMTRARDRLYLIQPQRFYTGSSRRNGDRHIYAARTRFVTDQMLGCFEKSAAGEGRDAGTAVDVAAKLRQMWV
jgi:DNA helicase-2/ATP-dependent DNA helicase PcrA